MKGITYMIVVVIMVAVIAVVLILLAKVFGAGVKELATSMMNAIANVATKAVSSLMP